MPLFGLGLATLVAAAEMLVREAVWFAAATSVSPLVLGHTVVASVPPRGSRR